MSVSKVFSERKNPERALQIFEEIFMPLVVKHAPMKKFTVRRIKTPWLDKELKEHMTERDKAKTIANKSNLKSVWQVYCKYRNFLLQN